MYVYARNALGIKSKCLFTYCYVDTCQETFWFYEIVIETVPQLWFKACFNIQKIRIIGILGSSTILYLQKIFN